MRIPSTQTYSREAIEAGLAMLDSPGAGANPAPFHEYTRVLLEQLIVTERALHRIAYSAGGKFELVATLREIARDAVA